MMFRKLGLSLLALFLWVVIPLGLLGVDDYLDSKFPPVTIAGRQGVFDHSWDDGYAYAQGTWVMENEQIGSPQNDAVIICRREIGTCFESTAEIFRGGASMRLLINRVDTHAIDHWDSGAITYSTANGCTRYTVTINRRTESVTARREPDPEGSAASCFGAAIVREAVLRTSLQDGGRVQQELVQRAQAQVAPWLWLGFGVWLLLVLRHLWSLWKRKPRGASNSAETKPASP